MLNESSSDDEDETDLASEKEDEAPSSAEKVAKQPQKKREKKVIEKKAVQPTAVAVKKPPKIIGKPAPKPKAKAAEAAVSDASTKAPVALKPKKPAFKATEKTSAIKGLDSKGIKLGGNLKNKLGGLGLKKKLGSPPAAVAPKSTMEPAAACGEDSKDTADASEPKASGTAVEPEKDAPTKSTLLKKRPAAKVGSAAPAGAAPSKIVKKADDKKAAAEPVKKILPTKKIGGLAASLGGGLKKSTGGLASSLNKFK